MNIMRCSGDLQPLGYREDEAGKYMKDIQDIQRTTGSHVPESELHPYHARCNNNIRW